MSSVQIRLSRDLEAAEWDRVTALCEEAFQESFEGYWKDIGPAVHFLLTAGSTLAAHACVVERLLQIGDVTLKTGYVEAVATAARLQGRGFGSATMRAVSEFICERYELGALSTDSHGFYARLGWETWEGPSFIRTRGGPVRTADADGSIMILRTPATPPLQPGSRVTAEWRPGELW